MTTNKAGCFLIDTKNMKVAIIYRKTRNDFSFPKGHLEKGESLEECALRETAEETKRDCKIVKEFQPIVEKYTTPSGEVCENHNFLAIDIGKSSNKSPDTHDMFWVNFEDVENKLSYENLKNTWRKAQPEILRILGRKK